MDFTKETNEALEKVIKEKLPQFIEERASKMVESIVESIFSWGDTKDIIKKKIEESINVNLGNFDLIDYNALIGKTINENLVKQINMQPIIDLTKNTIGFVNKTEITLDEIAEMVGDIAMEESNESEGEITFLIQENENRRWVEVSIDLDPDIKRDSCKVKFAFSIDDKSGRIFSFRTRDSFYDRNHKEVTPSRLASYDKLESTIFRLYSGQVKIKDYDYDVNRFWSRHD